MPWKKRITALFTKISTEPKAPTVASTGIAIGFLAKVCRVVSNRNAVLSCQTFAFRFDRRHLAKTTEHHIAAFRRERFCDSRPQFRAWTL